MLYEIQPAPSAHLKGSRITALPILLLNIHDHCNCRCVMCDIWKRKDGREFHAADLERHRESIKTLGVKHVVLTGGEPLVRRDFMTLVRALSRHLASGAFKELTLTTNGVRLAEFAAGHSALDLSQVQEIDTAGLQLLLMLNRELQGALKIRACSPGVRATLELTHLERLITAEAA